MLSKFCKKMHARHFLSNRIIVPINSHLPVTLVTKFNQFYKSNYNVQSQFTFVNFSSNVPKKPKIRTYVDYEKDFVQLQPTKCYLCYVVASAIGIAIAYEFWSNVKDMKPFSYLQEISFKTETERHKEDDIVHNVDSGPKEKPYYLARYVYI